MPPVETSTLRVKRGVLKWWGNDHPSHALHLFQVPGAILAFIIGVSFIYSGIVASYFAEVHPWRGSVICMIIALWVAYLAYLCKTPSAALTVGGYICLAIADLGPQYVVASRMYAPLWAVCLTGVGMGLLGMGLGFRLKLDKAIKRGSLPPIKVRTSPRIYGYELWQILEWLLIAIAVVFFILHIIFFIVEIKTVLFY